MQITRRVLLNVHDVALQLDDSHALARHTPCLGAFPVQGSVFDEAGLVPVQPLVHGQ